MNEIRIKVWKPVIYHALYKAALVRRTVKYEKLYEKLKSLSNFELDPQELMETLYQIGEEDYRNHRTFITVLAVRNEGFRLPDEIEFLRLVKSKHIPEHRELPFFKICELEKEKAIKSVLDRERQRKAPKHNLW